MSHIALLLPELEAGGAQRVMLLLAREFIARGHRVDIVLLSSAGPLLNSVPEGASLVDLKARGYGFGGLGFALSSVLRLTTWIKQERPDVLLSTINGANLVALLAQKLSAMPLRVVVREAASVKSINSNFRLRAMCRLYPQADAIIALSSVMVEDLIRVVGVSESRIHCIANPVDVAYIQEQSQAPLAHPWLDDGRLRVVLSVGRLIPQKDYATLLRSFALLPKEINARLIIVGEGPERRKLELLAIELKISDIVQFVGFDANPWRWTARANLFVLSSCSEGYPNVLLETLAIAVPVVATEYDASVIDLSERYGFKVVPQGKARVLAQAIESQLSSDSLQRYSLADDMEHVVANYLGVLGCDILSLG